VTVVEETGDAVTTRPRSTVGGRGTHDSLEANPGTGNTVTSRLRQTSGGRRSHDSPEANPGGTRSHDSPEAILGWETRPRLAQCHPRMGDTVTTCPRRRGQPRVGDAVTTRPEANPFRRRSLKVV
jgi:hypothetical protein